MKKLVALAAVAVSVATPALAQDDVRGPFTGPFAGGVIGYDNARTHIPGGGSNNNDGLLYGGNVGFDVNVGGALLGIEGEYTDSDTKNFASNVLVVGDRVEQRYDRDWYGGVRIGGQIAENFALYAKGGYTNARIRTFYNNNAGFTLDSAQNYDGYRLGAGLETTFRGLTGRVEYRYSNYGKTNEATSPQELERHQVAAIIGYRF